MHKKTVNLISLGCSKNLVDAEKILGQLDPVRYELMHDADVPADIVIINTCGFINDAKQESIDTILSFASYKEQGVVKHLYVIGCLSQRYRKELAAEIPEVDAWFGVDEPHRLFVQMRQSFDPQGTTRYLTTPSHYAYLKIAEGCDRTCSFCAIPMIRGKYRSVPVEQLYEEATKLASKGVKELILVAQDLSYYGRDWAGTPMLVPLIKQLLLIKEIEWIRLHYLYPKGFPHELIPLMAVEPRICKYLDMPLQHINDEILQSMRRGHDRHATIELITQLRRELPSLAFRTTIMVGYPGESSQAFQELKDFVEHTRFERLGVFAYSAEEGTKAYALQDTLTEKAKQKRRQDIMKLQQKISEARNANRVGQQMKVVIDRVEEDYLVGRTEFDSPEVDNEVLIDTAAGLKPGDFVQVRITASSAYELYAKIVS